MSKKNAITVSLSSYSYDFVIRRCSGDENRKPSNFIDTTIASIAPIWEDLEKEKGKKLTLSEVMAELRKLVPE